METLESELSESELIISNNRISTALGMGRLICRDVIHDNDGIRWTFVVNGHQNGNWKTSVFAGQTSREALVKMNLALRKMANDHIDEITSVLEH